MNRESKRILLHTVIYAVLFFLLPLYLRNRTGTMSDLGALVTLLLLVNPAVILVLSGELGLRLGFRPVTALQPAILFALSVFIVFEASGTALIYSAAYGLISLLGNAAGAYIRKRTMR
ncbi:hypothetical protein J2Z22_002630 [Paenibacillus forsythiae]|uniref:Uncharacterized protein n=1 Tax=Paenibacillus forsythiae TaxID=365616 RepID=A0ABU3H8E1_9BACL|nr:hypothetical protein [Paenibacillus forsythiae]MDT3427094.1 hypothetical protein [Paenibacillus forsythiae]